MNLSGKNLSKCLFLKEGGLATNVGRALLFPPLFLLPVLLLLLHLLSIFLLLLLLLLQYSQVWNRVIQTSVC